MTCVSPSNSPLSLCLIPNICLIQYYGAEDDDEKPVFSDEDEAVLRELAKVPKEEEEEEEDPKAAAEELARLREQLKAKKAEIKKDVEAYYKLDYEDMVLLLYSF